MDSRKLILKLGKRFPKRIALKYHDYVGHMVGKLKPDVKRIVLCLDFDETILAETLAFEPDLIITHHPFLFGKPKFVLEHDEGKRKLYNYLEEINLPIYSYHTPFDEGVGGMNDALAEKAELSDIKPLVSQPMARGGVLPHPMKMDELARYLMEKFDVKHCLPMNYGVEEIKSIAIIGGGGWYGFQDAKNEGYDCYISGDIPHHGRREVILNKCNYIDMPHEIENIFMEQMKKILLEIDPTLEITIIKHEKYPDALILA